MSPLGVWAIARVRVMCGCWFASRFACRVGHMGCAKVLGSSQRQAHCPHRSLLTGCSGTLGLRNDLDSNGTIHWVLLLEYCGLSACLNHSAPHGALACAEQRMRWVRPCTL